ncbi:MAG: hypothetical protein J6Y49_01475 [Alphaproteobacteria bacterium]|nr:hypothetical protein [Alphaproteobacteria bacterium]
MFSHIRFLRCLIAAVAVCGGLDALAVQAPNPRGSSATSQNVRSNDSVSRVAVTRPEVRASNVRESTHGVMISNAARGASTVARSAKTTGPARAANARSTTNARTASTPNVSRTASTARATAVFNDVSKIGSGYAACRDSYATCMDQFCANANDTYRRCFCSSRFADFRNTENALDEAKTLLMKFEDNNLNAVDKTAAEVNAMYTATVGEAAIKKDTSGAAKILDEIGDLLSGKKKASTTSSISNSLGILSFDLTDDVDDIWADGGSALFGGGQNFSDLEGVSLYNAANKQCNKLINDVCQSSAVANMARSSYSIMITQDCNAYQKNIDKKVESVKQTVRTAEKYLREARLEEYRSHNSANVNECISKVRSALTADTACGANYKRCLDYTGVYINQTTGEAIYSPRLFKLTEVINLDGVNSDVLAQNPDFDKFLESKKIFAASALDTCRDISKIVWEEFKRTALIEIAQAQDEKIEEVKMSCVSTMADCYDTQSSALKDFDNTTAQMVGALSAYAAKQMCIDKVSACAALYGNGETCVFDSKTGKLTNTSACGLTALTNFVDAVDNIRITEGCETALQNYAKELCTPTAGTMGYPWNCRLKDPSEIYNNLSTMAQTYCSTDVVRYQSTTVDSIINNLVTDISMEISDAMAKMCEERNGIWFDWMSVDTSNDPYEPEFYRAVYGSTKPITYGTDNKELKSYGACFKNTVKFRCEVANVQTGNNNYAKYDALTNTCRFTLEYYKYECDMVNGTWENDRCYLDKD